MKSITSKSKQFSNCKKSSRHKVAETSCQLQKVVSSHFFLMLLAIVSPYAHITELFRLLCREVKQCHWLGVGSF